MLSSYMDRQTTITTDSTGAKSSKSVPSGNGKKRPSRLEELRDQLHARLMREKEQKMVAMYERQQQQALQKVSRTFRHQIPGNSSPKTVNKLNGTGSRTETGVKETPRRRAVFGGRHNALEPLDRVPRPSLARPTVPNNRYTYYNSHVPLPDEDVSRKGSGLERRGRVALARPHLSRHPKLPAVADTRCEEALKLGKVQAVRTDDDALTEELAKKKREILLQLHQEQTALENIQRQRKEVDRELVSGRNEQNSFFQTQPRRQSRKDSRRSSKSLNHSTQQVEESLPSSSHFENGILESSLQEPAVPTPHLASVPAESSATGMDLVPCSVCGRKFAAERVEKHVSVCEKSQKKKKRKVFDTHKMRLAGTEMANYQPHKKAPARIQKQPKKANWRAAHGK